MNKKIFAWIMTLALVVSLLPVPGMHNHAHAACDHIGKKYTANLSRTAACGAKIKFSVKCECGEMLVTGKELSEKYHHWNIVGNSSYPSCKFCEKMMPTPNCRHKADSPSTVSKVIYTAEPFGDVRMTGPGCTTCNVFFANSGDFTLTVGKTCDHSDNTNQQTNCLEAVACSECGETAIDAKTAHTPAAEQTNCAVPVACSKCSQTAIAAKPHTPEADQTNCAVAVDCSECGETAIAAKAHTPEAEQTDCAVAVDCSVCGETAIAAKAHTPEAEQTDCAVAVDCSVCGKTAIAAKAHTPEADQTNCAVAVDCSVCGETAIAAKDHTPEADDGDCTTNIECSECGTETTAAKPHTPAADDGDCTTAIVCTVCGTETTAAKPHTPAADDGSCLTAVECSVCGKTATPAKEKHAWQKDGHCANCDVVCEHTNTESVTVDSTCKKEGSITTTCKTCGHVDVEALPLDKENGHDWIVFSFGGWICSRCNEMTNENPTDEPDPTPVLPEPSNPCPADEHKWIVFSFGGWVCEKCGMMTNENPTDEPDPTPALPEVTDPCPADEHDWIVFSFGGWVCSKCGTMTNVCPDEHTWENSICTVCGTKCAHDDVTEEVIKAATCKKEGSAKVTCNDCGNVEDVILPVDKEDGHDWIVFSFGGWICSRCNEMTIDNPTDEPDPTPVLPQPSNPCPDDEHKWIVFSFGGWICEKCNMMTNENPTDEPDPTPALPEPENPCEPDEHDLIEFAFGGWVCTKCGLMTNEKPCKHVWEDGVCGQCGKECEHEAVTETVTKAATCKKEGSATVTCDICGDVETKVLPVDKEDGHDWIVFSFGGWICSRCGEITIDNPTDEPDPTPVLPQPSNPCPDDEHKWIVFSFGGWICEKCFMMTNENPTDEPDPTPVLPEPSNPCPADEHDWIVFSFGGWVCSKCGMMTNENPIQPEYRDGDVNGDGAVDGRDVIRLMKYLVGGASIVESAADLNDDGVIDGRDVIRLMKKLL